MISSTIQDENKFRNSVNHSLFISYTIVEKRLSLNKQQQDIEIKSIFNSDDEEESLQPQIQHPRASSKRSIKSQPQSNNQPKKNRYDTNKLLEEFDKTINREMKRSASTPTKAELYRVDYVMNSILDKSLKQIREELALQEAFYRQSNNNEEKKEPEEVDEDMEVKSATTPEPSQTSSSSIEILEGEEREKVMEDEYEGTDNKIVLKLRDVEDESKVVVIRMGRVW